MDRARVVESTGRRSRSFPVARIRIDLGAISGGAVYHRARRRPRPHHSRPHPAEVLEPRVLLATFTVTNTLNSGAGSLRQAITDANATTAADVIRFALPVSGGTVASIHPATPLPAITAPLDIDGTTQAGYAQSRPVVELSGDVAGANASGLVFTNASDSRVRGLIINRWTAAGIRVTGGTGVVIESNFIGLTSNGSAAAANVTGVVIADAGSCRVGGTTAAQRNAISGNTTGVLIGRDTGDVTPTADDNVVTGNYIGTAANGNAAVPNTRSGVRVAGATNRTVIGGTAAGAGNLVSGNTQDGVAVDYPANAPNRTPAPSLGVRIEGNTIGLGAAGAALPNATGVLCVEGGIVVGGTAAGARNIISGNTIGVRVTGEGRVEGNYIGLNAAGTAAAPNGVGVQIQSSSGARIGSDQPGARNVISGNTTAGVRVVLTSAVPLPPDAFHRIQGNYVGLNAAGTAAIPNHGVGIELVKATNVLVGGDTAAAANVVCGNTDGIRIDGSQGTNVRGNSVGVNAAGAAIPNSGTGVLVTGGSMHSTVSANVIAENRGNGIAVLDGAGNAFLSNSIHSNGGLGIDLGGDGVTPNDSGDADTGPNELRNFPVLTSILNDGTNLFIRGSVEGQQAASSVRIQFFDNPTQDPTGFGEGATYLGELTVGIGVTGRTVFDATVPAVQAGHFISATATGIPTAALPPSFVQTSEFSQVMSVPAADTTPPHVAGVFANGTTWAPSFREYLASAGLGSSQWGYAIPSGRAQLAVLPWVNVNEITVSFDEPVNVRLDSLVIRGAGGPLVVTAFIGGRVSTWRLASPVRADRLALELKSGDSTGVKDLVGRPLDGEWADGADNFPSGDGAAGGDFAFAFNVLPGDVNGDGSVLADDFSAVKKRFFKDTTDATTGDASYSAFHDVDGSGSILADDYSEVKKRFFDALPPLAAAAPSGATRVAEGILA